MGANPGQDGSIRLRPVVETEEEARAICQRYNDSHDSGFLSRKAEYEER